MDEDLAAEGFCSECGDEFDPDEHGRECPECNEESDQFEDVGECPHCEYDDNE